MNLTLNEIQKKASEDGFLEFSKKDFLKIKSDFFKKSDTIAGTPPEGFGPVVEWLPNQEIAAVVLWLNAADRFGAMISGVTKFDTIEIISAVGSASFSEETKNEHAGSFIGLVSTAADVIATGFGAPEIVPIIEAGEKFANEVFKPEKVKTKVRDAFGVGFEEIPGFDVKTEIKARQEGGVAISLPTGAITRTFESGPDLLEAKRWIKKPGDRTDKNLPEHMKGKGAFFLQPDVRNFRQVKHAGDILIYPWDHIWDDNFGFYRLHIILTRRDSSIFDENVP